MVKKKSQFMVGLFVITGVMIGVILLVWIGASSYFQKGSAYVTYFDESVQGLQVDSGVKYLGVDVGRVEKIRVAPDNNLIEILMKIDFKSKPEFTTTATLKMAGLTGIVYIELDKRKIKDAGLSPKISFPTEYPVIPSRPSDIRQITTSIDEVIQKIRKIDFNGIAGQLNSTVKAVETFVNNDKLKKMVANLESATANLEGVTQKVDGILAKGTVEEILIEARDGVRDARKLIVQTQKEVDSLKMGDTVKGMNQLIDNANRKIEQLSNEIQATTESLRDVVDNMDDLVGRVRADPSSLIFSDPPPKKEVK